MAASLDRKARAGLANN